MNTPMSRHFILEFVCVCFYSHACALLPQYNICLCSDHNIGPLALQMEELFFLCLVLHYIFLSSCHNYHLKLHTRTPTQTHIFVPEHTYAKLTKQTVCDPFKNPLKIIASNF